MTTKFFFDIIYFVDKKRVDTKDNEKRRRKSSVIDKKQVKI